MKPGRKMEERETEAERVRKICRREGEGLGGNSVLNISSNQLGNNADLEHV